MPLEKIKENLDEANSQKKVIKDFKKSCVVREKFKKIEKLKMI